MKSILRKNLLRRAGIPALAFAAVFALLLIFYALYGIFPCGKNTLVWCDMEQQAVPLLMQLKEMAAHGETISYTALDAGGMQFYGIFFFFLSNPLSLLIFVTDIPADQLVGLLVIVKLSLSAATAACWLKYRYRMLAPAHQLLLGMMYGCCGYGMFYFQNLMWLDIMAMMPVLMISLRMLLKKRDPRLYCITLSAMMLLCFYLCYMTVLFVIIYVALSLRLTVPKKRRGKTAVRFLAASLLAAAGTAFVWLPCVLQILHSARGSGIIAALMADPLTCHLGDRITLLCCTPLCLAAIPVILLRTGQPRKRNLLLLFLLGTATFFDPVNMMWHIGSYQAFPYRWGMVPVLLLLTAAAGALAGRRPLRSERLFGRHPYIPLMLTAGIALAASGAVRCLAAGRMYSYTESLWVSPNHAILALLLGTASAAAYFTALRCWQERRIPKKLCTGIMAVLFLTEFSLNFDCFPGSAANADGLFAQTVSAAGNIQDDGTGLARVRLTRKYAHANMLGALGAPTLAHYTSLTREDYLRGVKRFGYSSYWMEVPSTGGTVLSDAFWHVRYQLGTKSDLPSWAEPVWTDNLLTLGESNLLLPGALYLDTAPEEMAELPVGSRADAQRFLAEEIGADDPVIEYEPTDLNNVTLTQDESGHTVCRLTGAETGEIRYTVFVTGRQALYFDLNSPTGTELDEPYHGAVNIIRNGAAFREEYPQQNDNGLVPLGTAENQYLVISITVNSDFDCDSFGLFGMNLDLLEQSIAAAEGTELHYRGGVYTAHCETDAPKTLLLSAAYDEGLYAEINGQPAEVFRVNTCQAAVQIPAGSSDVTVRFRVSGLRAGLLLGIGGIAGILLMRLLYRCSRRLRKAAETASRRLVTAAFWGILLMIYVFPMILYYAGIAASSS